jgi:competence protein ComEA
MKKRVVLFLSFALVVLGFVGYATAADKPAASKPAAPAKAVELLDINSATAEQLAALPAIGDVYAKKIIDGRPYAQKDDLVNRKIITKLMYSKIRTLIIAKQAPTK